MKPPDTFRSEGRRRLNVDTRTCVELGELLGVSHQTVSQLRNGQIEPGLRLAVRIESVCGIPTRTWCADAIASTACGPADEVRITDSESESAPQSAAE